MNVPHVTSGAPGVSPPADCLSDRQLCSLIEAPQVGAQPAALIAHLDRCDGCRHRLERMAADDHQWTAIRRNLCRSDADEDVESTRLTAAIGMLQDETRADLSESSCETPPLEAEPIGEIPSHIGPYQIVELVGRGGMGRVYKAYDPSLERFVAVKLITHSLVEHPDALQRFRREARSAAAVRDPHVVSIHAVEDSPPQPYLVMEFVEGPSLEERLRREGRLDWREAARIGADVAAGLAAAHASGVIHRDIKPGNILIEQRSGAAKIGDFGLARSIEDSSLTQTGCVRGTPDESGTPPMRVQIVTPEVLMRERIQAEKDRLDVPQHPLLVREYPGHTGPVTDLAVTPDGKLLVSCSGWPTGDRTVRVWNVATGKELRRFDTAAMPQNPGASGPREAPGEFFTVAITPDGRQAVTGSTGGAVCVWDIATGRLIRQFEKHTATVYDAAITPQGDQVLTGGRSGIGRLWDLSTGEELMQLPGHRTWIRTVAISPDGKRTLTGCYDRVMRMWDLERAKMIREFPTQDEWVWDIAFDPSGRMAAAVSGTHVQLWDLESGKLLRTLTCGDAGNGTSVDISPDGRLAISGSYDGKVRLWSVDTGELLETYTGHRDWVRAVRFLPDGRHAASAGGGRYSATGDREAGIDFTLRLWKLPPTGPRVAEPE